ncbi:MAG: glycosyltransferase family 39 protein [Corynebacterium sp.]|nr:glycosyltransferase family 39 protein [Corynebacterium sp.]
MRAQVDTLEEGPDGQPHDADPAKKAGRFALAATPQPDPPHIWTRADTVSTVTIGALAFLMRLFLLPSATAGGTPVFDEKHYVPQAFDMVESQMNAILGGLELNPGYGLVVHPPLGKQVLAIGIEIFGYNPWGWRMVTALCGTAVIVLIMAIARRLSRSTTIATFAGILALTDGVLLTASRFGMLDIIQVLFIVAATWMLVCDNEQMEWRMHNAAATISASPYGPRMGFRWWRFGAGVLLGLALSVKWSGLYYMAFFGILIVVLDALRRRRYGVQKPWVGTLLRDCFPAFASIVILPAALYVWSWRAWFANENAVYRHAATDGSIDEGSLLNHLPDTLASWFYYHQRVLDFHASLTNSAGNIHPWESKPWAWLVAGRPILYYSSTGIECGDTTCRRMIFLFGTPAIWWLTIPVLLWALWSMVIRRNFTYLFPFVLFMAGFVPWLANFDRQMYFFYATALVPATIIMLALALGEVLQYRTPANKRWLPAGATWQGVAVATYLGVAIVCFCYFSPIMYGFRISDAYYDQMMWLPSWT